MLHRYTFIYLILPVAFLVIGCQKNDVFPEVSTPGEEIVFSSARNQIITRNGLEGVPFDEGTKYDLYAIKSNSVNQWSAEYAIIYNKEGTEENGYINYGRPMAKFPDSGELDFYAVTYDTKKTPVPTTLETPGSPVYHIEQQADGSLPDLLRASTKGRSALSGKTINLNFKHTLSKLRFEIVRQKKTDPADFYEDTYIQSIVLNDMYKEAYLNLASGNYVTGDNVTGDNVEKINRTFYERAQNDAKQQIDTIQTTVKKNNSPETDEEILIFPRTGNEPEGFSISVVIGKKGDDNWKQVKCKMEYYDIDDNGTIQESAKNFEFKPNYEYVITLVLTDNTVRIMLIQAQVYEWIEENQEDIQGFFGKPVSFGGVLWMDRNLGATSADPENDWVGCRGYFYQWGRSIPYMVDPEKKNSKMQNIYTFDNNGNRVYGYMSFSEDREEETVAWLPGEIPSESYSGNSSVGVACTGYELICCNGGTDDDGYWLGKSKTASSKMTGFWKDPNNQPCPPGWRIPGKNDFATFMPDPAFGNTWQDDNLNKKAIELDKPNNNNAYIEDRIYGKVNDILNIFMLKRKGRSDAYRIRIRLLSSQSNAAHKYYEIQRFTGSEDDNFENCNYTSISTAFDWNHPVESMTIAATGYIYPRSDKLGIDNGWDQLAGVGSAVMLRSIDSYTENGGWTWACYFRTDWNFGSFNGNTKAVGANIRCIRDL